jgi:TolB-like protein/Flp pilus assembly protein TadD
MTSGNSLFAELKRRNVIRMAGLYLVGAWLVTQVSSTVLPMFGAPDWLPRTIVILLAIGFVPTMIFSWIYELTPEGLKRDADVPLEQSIGRETGRRIDRTIIVVLLLALIAFAFDRFVILPQAPANNAAPVNAHASGPATAAGTAATESAQPNEKSIAVLPFENLSDEKANAYFAAGIQDEILTRLARVGALKVISRTSTMHYTSAPDNLPLIARQLGVANILEGSVQKAGEAVHINVQLIRAATDEHLWADSYNRKLDDVFAVEGEVAQTIAERLKATLTGAEVQQLSAAPTRNRAAYDAYLRGLDSERRVFGPEQLKEASRYFAQAAQLDPEFASAWAHGSDADGLLYSQAFDRSDARLQAARRGADNAMRLAPESAEAWRAKGTFLYHIQDFAGAEAAFAEAARREPNNPDIFAAQGYLQRRRGDYPSAIQLFQRSLERDPQNVTNLSGLGETLDFVGQQEEARIWIDRALALRPNDPSLLTQKCATYLNEGDLDSAGRILDTLPLQLSDTPSFELQVSYLIFRRRFADAIAALKQVIASPDFVFDGWTSAYYPQLGWAERWSGDEAHARATFVEGKRRVTALQATWQDNGYLSTTMAMLEAGLGDVKAVEREGRRSLELTAGDKFIHAGLLTGFAAAQALAGLKEEALATLAQAQLASGVQYGDLRYSPSWDNLRGDPRFQALVEKAHRSPAP